MWEVSENVENAFFNAGIGGDDSCRLADGFAGGFSGNGASARPRRRRIEFYGGNYLFRTVAGEQK